MSQAYPQPGSVVEFLEDNVPKIAMTLEESGGKLRLLLPGRRELKLGSNRVLPWIGPTYSQGLGKDEAARILEKHQAEREQKAARIPMLEIWEMAQGEIAHARAEWFAELMESDPNEDTVAAYGRALLGSKSHFRFQPPEFQVYDAETVEKRLAEQKARQQKEAFAAQGTAFVRQLWDLASKRQILADASGAPEERISERLRKLLYARVVNPDSDEDEALWRLLSKGLPEVPHLPLQLLIAWGVLEPHYNFWLDRADYAVGDDWWREEDATVAALAKTGENPFGLEACDLPFLSIDGPTTVDIDDAFHIRSLPDGYELVLAFAAPALVWPFGENLDRLVMHRATSVYLPDGDLHMLPVSLGAGAYSLLEKRERPAFCLRARLDGRGNLLSTDIFLAKIRLAANLRYEDAQAALADPDAANPASAFAGQLRIADELAQKREALRIENGAVVMLRQEPKVSLEGSGAEVKVSLEPEKPQRDSQRIVTEMMILGSAAAADWAYGRGIPLLHRSQNVTLPREYAGIWENPADLARIMRSLVPSTFEIAAKPHAALGLERYAQITSPLRRYPDLINEGQLINFIRTGSPRWDEAGLAKILDAVSPALEAVGHAQRFRPRYWKLLYFRQQGDKIWRFGIITDANDMFVNVALPVENINVRGRRNLFDERATPGAGVKIRLGKINPLQNEIQILEVQPADAGY